MRRLIAGALVAACVACGPKLGPGWTEAHLREAAVPASDAAEAAAVVPVWADSEEEAWGRVVQAQTESPLDESQRLTAWLDEPRAVGAEVWTGGPFAPLNDQVLIDALKFTKRARVPGVRIVFVSPEPPSPELEALLAKRGVAWVHRAWTATFEDPAPGSEEDSPGEAS